MKQTDSLPDGYYRRVEEILKPEHLADKHVLVVGCGSGGGLVADQLIRTGLQRMTLLDIPGERLEPHNIIRHVLGFRSLGKLKVTELKSHLLNIRPDAGIDAVELNAETEGERLGNLVADENIDMILICTDNDPSRYVANEIAISQGVSMVYGSVFDGGVGGEVGRYHPRHFPACYGCMVLSVGRAFQPAKEINIDYSNVKESTREARAASALNLDIGTIANLHARMALYTLLRDVEPDFDDIPGNFTLFWNRLQPGVDRSLRAKFYHFSTHPNCLLCATRAAPAEGDMPAMLLS